MLQPLLPIHVNTHRFGGGRLRVPDRACTDAIFFVLRTGCQWRVLDQTELCAHSTAHDRFQAWVEAGVFLQFWQVGVQRFDELCRIEWDWLALDGAITKAPLGGGAGTFVDEPVSPTAHSLGQETGELSGVSAFCLWLDCLLSRLVVRIGG